MPAELTQFPASQRVGGRRAALEAVDVQFAPVEVDLLPLQIGYFRSAQAVPVGYEHHERISTAASVAPRRLDHPLNLFRPQMLSLAQVFVFWAGRRLEFCHCPIFSGWRHQLELRLCHDKSAPRDRYFPISDRIRGWWRYKHHRHPEEDQAMPRSIAIKALAAATLGLAIAFAPAAFAADDMKKDTMTKQHVEGQNGQRQNGQGQDVEGQHEKRFDEKRRYEEIKHIRACRVRPRGPCTLSADLISERRACQKRSAWSSSTGSGCRRCGRNASTWQVLIMLNPNRVTVFYRLGVGKQNGDAEDRN